MKVMPITALLLGLIVSAASGQVPPPEADQIQQDAQLLFEDLQAHRLQLEQTTVDDYTLQLQDEILTVWDRLLDQADKQAKSKSDSKNDQQQQAPQNQPPKQQPQNTETPSQNSSQQMKGQQPEQQPMPQPGEGPGQGETDNQPAQEDNSNQPADQASEETRERERTRLLELKQAERERLMKEVWGKLPPRIRQKLLNASDEQYLPAYEERIREYFRKLSTPNEP